MSKSKEMQDVPPSAWAAGVLGSSSVWDNTCLLKEIGAVATVLDAARIQGQGGTRPCLRTRAGPIAQD